MPFCQYTTTYSDYYLISVDYRFEKDLFRSITQFREFYNTDRPHSINGYQTPNKYEADYYKEKLSKILEQLDSFNKGVYILYQYLKKTPKVLLDTSNVIISKKALKPEYYI